MRAAIYVRVSTASKSRQGDAVSFDQNPEVQEQPLRELVTQRGWQLHRVCSDRMSGAKERRPGVDSLMSDARRGQFDVVVVWRFDRFARSVKQLVLALEEFRALGVGFLSHQEDFLKLPHYSLVKPGARIAGQEIVLADSSYLQTRCRFTVMMPQWDFLNFLAEQGRSPTLRLNMQSEVTDLIEEQGRMAGVRGNSRGRIPRAVSPLCSPKCK